MRLIDADALMKDLAKWIKEVDPEHPPEVPPMEDIIVSTLMTIEEQPTVEERKTGKWRAFKIGECDLIECTACKVARPREEMPARNGGKIVWKYCPDCGARMEE